jgi:hypothetical protein
MSSLVVKPMLNLPGAVFAALSFPASFAGGFSTYDPPEVCDTERSVANATARS